jgi:hypothetical protein
MTSVLFNEYDRGSHEGTPEEVAQSSDSEPSQTGSLEVEYMYHAANTGFDASGLSERDRGILEFERQWWTYAGAKEQAIRELFDMSSTRYYQVLNSLIDTPEALEFDPMLVKRLRRMRASRQQARSASRASY